jgi:OFA family oxalate/formate antiporter-like MFS transporter
MVLFPLANGLSRVAAGFISDRIGREKTMVVFYSLLGVSIFCFVLFARAPLLFVSIVSLAALLGGAPLALYPALIGDYYGAGYSTTNYGITYTAKALAGFVSGWFSGYLVMRFGSFRIPLLLVAVFCMAAAVLSLPNIMKPPVKNKDAAAKKPAPV